MVIKFIVNFVVTAACVALAQQTNYQYDVLSRLTRVAYADGTAIAYTYDVSGNRLSQVIANSSIPLPKVGIDKNTLTFSAASGQAAPVQIVVVTNAGGGNLQWNAVATATWLSVTPGSGTNSGAVNVIASAAGMSAGTYNANVTILASASNAPVAIPVIFTVTPALGNPSIGSGGIVSAAGSNPGIARGSIASLYGTALADAPAVAATVPLPRTLGNVQVSLNGVSAPLWYVDPQQINFQVPFEAPLQGQASVVVTRDGVASSPMTVALTPYAPSIFTYQRVTGVFDPVIVHATDNQLVTPSDPAVAGEYVVVYGTGIGDLTVALATDTLSPMNPPAAAKVTPTATIGGVNAPVSFAGLTPGLIGLAQFNIQVPAALPQGNALPLIIQFGSISSQPVNLAVQPTGPKSYTISTLAGDGNAGFSGDGGAATNAQLDHPHGLTVDPAGNLYIADSFNHRVRKVSSGVITTVAGNGTQGFSGDDGPATSAQLNNPYGVAVDPTGNLYIADLVNYRIRKVSNGVITTVAGNGKPGLSGDNGPAISTPLEPDAVAMDSAGNLYTVDYFNNRICKVSNGVITPVAGNGTAGYSGDNGPATSAQLNSPAAVVVDPAGNLYIADALNNRIRKVSNGVITTVAGNGTQGFSGDNGPAISAQLNRPNGVAVDSAGDLYIADYSNSRIRKVSSGVITTVAGNGTYSFSGDNGPATSAQLSPAGLAVTSAGNIYIADFDNNRIRVLTPTSTAQTGESDIIKIVAADSRVEGSAFSRESHH